MTPDCVALGEGTQALAGGRIQQPRHPVAAGGREQPPVRAERHTRDPAVVGEGAQGLAGGLLEVLTRGSERPVPGERKQVGCRGAALLRLRQTLGLHLYDQPPVQVIDGEELRPARHAIAEHVQEAPGERGVVLARLYQRDLIASGGGKHIGAVDVDLTDHLGHRICHGFADYPPGEAAVEDDDLGSRGAVEDGAAQLVVFQRIELWLRPFAAGQPEVQVVPPGAYQAVADEVNQEKILCLAGRRPQVTADQTNVCLILQHSAMVLRDDAIDRIGEGSSQVTDGPADDWQVGQLVVRIPAGADQHRARPLPVRERHRLLPGRRAAERLADQRIDALIIDTACVDLHRLSAIALDPDPDIRPAGPR